MLRDYISKGKKWAKDHEKGIVTVGIAGIFAGIGAYLAYNLGYQNGYHDCWLKADEGIDDIAHHFADHLLEVINECGFESYVHTVEKISKLYPDVYEVIDKNAKADNGFNLTTEVCDAYYDCDYVVGVLKVAKELKASGEKGEA